MIFAKRHFNFWVCELHFCNFESPKTFPDVALLVGGVIDSFQCEAIYELPLTNVSIEAATDRIIEGLQIIQKILGRGGEEKE